MSTGIITATKIFEGSPAEEAGMLPGDVLYQVDSQEVTGEDLTQVVSRIKGEEHTTVMISIVREGSQIPWIWEVERRTIEVSTVEHRMLDGSIGYIAVSSFDDVTVNQFLDALNDLEAQGEESLIIDLRNNGGGLVSSVCQMLDRLLPEGLIVYTEDKYGHREEEYSDAENHFDKPLAVLVNGNSASASEIFAGSHQGLRHRNPGGHPDLREGYRTEGLSLKRRNSGEADRIQVLHAQGQQYPRHRNRAGRGGGA